MFTMFAHAHTHSFCNRFHRFGKIALKTDGLLSCVCCCTILLEKFIHNYLEFVALNIPQCIFYMWLQLHAVSQSHSEKNKGQ